LIQLMSASEICPCSMMAPANMNIGMARNGKLSSGYKSPDTSGWWENDCK
jgi:hypothetical protein